MKNLDDESGDLRLLGVFAHPDDETFCAGGTMAKYVAAGAEAMVVSFTRGEAGQIRDAGAATRRTLGQVREQELRQACKHLGIQNVMCLDYGDGKLKDVASRTLVGKVVQIIRTFRPEIVFTFGEEGAYGHPDHIAISSVTTDACRLAGHEDQFTEQIAEGLSPHSPAQLSHSHFPRNRLLLMDHLVRWLTSLDKRFRGSPDFIQGLTLFASESTTMGFNSDHVKVGWYPPGFYIIEQGEPATSLYLILSGRADVLREDSTGAMSKVAQLGPGEFVGEVGLAYGQPRNAHVVALDSVTCLVFSPGQPTVFAGRGKGAQFATATVETNVEGTAIMATTCIDVSEYIPQKVAAMVAYRTQYHISSDMFPEAALREMLGHEYFVRIYPPIEMETELFPIRTPLNPP